MSDKLKLIIWNINNNSFNLENYIDLKSNIENFIK